MKRRVCLFSNLSESGRRSTTMKRLAANPPPPLKKENPKNGRLNLLHSTLSPAFLIPADCHQWAGMKELSSTLFFEAQRACRCSTFAEWNTWRWNLKLQSWRHWWEAASSRCKDRSSSPDGVPDNKWTTAVHIVRLRRQKAAARATISSSRAASLSTIAFRRNFCISGQRGIFKGGRGGEAETKSLWTQSSF